MAVIKPNINEAPATTYNAAAVPDRTDDFAGRSDSMATGELTGMGVTTAASLTLTIAAGTVSVLGVTYTYAGGTATVVTNAGLLDRRDVLIYRVGTGVMVLQGTTTSYTPGATMWTTSSVGNPPVKPDVVEATDMVMAEIYMPYNAAIVDATPNAANGYVIDKSSTIKSIASPTFGGNVTMATGILTGTVGTTTSITNRAYVDFAVQTWPAKGAVVAATTVPLPANVYANGTAGGGATLTASAVGVLTIDGVTPVAGQRVLVKNEAAALGNGIYTVTTLGTVSVAYVLTRAIDSNNVSKFVGATVPVTTGTANLGTMWSCANTVGPTMGTTAIVWAQADITAAGVVSLEQMIRNQSLDQMSPPASDLFINNRRIINMANPIWPTDAATGYAGMSSVAGAPTTGTWVAGNWIVDSLGRIYYCTVAGTPGTWLAPAATPPATAGASALALNVAGRLPVTTADAMLYVKLSTAGTAFSIAIGPTSTPATTIWGPGTPAITTLFSVRVPANWYVLLTSTSGAIATATYVTC